jgi:hypothetical protein
VENDLTGEVLVKIIIIAAELSRKCVALPLSETRRDDLRPYIHTERELQNALISALRNESRTANSISNSNKSL